MTGELFINDKDAYTEWGINMGEGFIESIMTPAPLKEFVENTNRLINGKQVLYNNPKLNSRDVQLLINIEGKTQSEYLSRYNSFCTELQKGIVKINIPSMNKTFRLTYLNSPKMTISRSTFCVLTIKFNEPNPANRGVNDINDENIQG